ADKFFRSGSGRTGRPGPLGPANLAATASAVCPPGLRSGYIETGQVRSASAPDARLPVDGSTSARKTHARFGAVSNEPCPHFRPLFEILRIGPEQSPLPFQRRAIAPIVRLAARLAIQARHRPASLLWTARRCR